MYRFVNVNDDSGADVDPVAKSINTQTMAINNMGKTINGIAQTVVTLKNIALHNLKEEERRLKTKFKPKYAKQQQNPFKSLMLNVKAYKVKGFLESMLSFLGSLLKIFIIRPILNWLSDPANKTKLVKILESTWKVLKGITEFLGSQFVHAINELHDVLSGETSIWKKITSFTKLWIKFAAGFLAIKFLRNPVKLLRQVANVGKILAIKTKLAKAQLTKRKKFLTGGKWARGKWLLGGAVGATVLWQFANWALGQAGDKEKGDDSSPNQTDGGNRGKDRAFSIKEYGEDLTSDFYPQGLAGLFGGDKKEEKKDEKKWYDPRTWGKNKKKEPEKKNNIANLLGLVSFGVGANEQIKGLKTAVENDVNNLKGTFKDGSSEEKMEKIFQIASILERSLGVQNDTFGKLHESTQNLVESAKGATNGDKASWEDLLKWAGHEVQSREQGGPVGPSFANGGKAKWLDGPDTGYAADHNGQPMVAHGMEGLFTKSGSNDGFIVPFDNAATRNNPMLTMTRLAQAKRLGFTNAPPGFERGGFNLFNPMSWFGDRKAQTFMRGAHGDRSVQIQGNSLAAQVGRNRQNLNALMAEMGYATGGPLGLGNLKDNKTYRISQDKGWFEKSKVKSGGGNWFSRLMQGHKLSGFTGSPFGDKGSGGNFGMGVGKTFGTPQAYQEPQSGGLGLVQRLIASHRGDELTQALLARTVFNRKAVIDKTGNAQMFRAKSGSLHDILHAPGQYPNVESGRIKGSFSSSELNAAGKAMKLAKDANKLKERLQEGGLDPAKAQQLLTSTMFKPGSGLNKGGLAGLLTGGGGVRFGNYTFQNKPTNAMNSLLGGMNPLMLKSMMSLVSNIVGGKDGNMGKDLVMMLASGVLGGGKKGKGDGMMDMLFGMFGLPTKRGNADQKGGGMSAGLGTVMKGIFGGKGGKDKKEERMEAQKKQNDKHRQIMKFHAAEQKRAVQSSLFQKSKQNCDEVIAAVQANNNKCAQNAQSGSEAVARLSQQSQQQAGNSFMGIFKSLASKLSSSKSK